jgi:hypothetical protein
LALNDCITSGLNPNGEKLRGEGRQGGAMSWTGSSDLPAMANQIFALGCGKSTRRANHFGFSEMVSSPFCKNISVFT